MQAYSVRGMDHGEHGARAVAARGYLPPGANVCVAAPANEIGNWFSYGYNDGIGVDCAQYARLGYNYLV